MKNNLKRFFTVSATLGLVFAIWAVAFNSEYFAAKANGYYLEIADGAPLTQNWSNTSLLNGNNDWTQVIAIEAFRGTGLAPVAGTDPRTVLADGAGTPSIFANQTNPATSTADGVAEFEIANPTVALKGSDSASAPHIVIHVNTLTGCTGKAVNVNFKARDIDGSANNAISPIAVQYRIGGSGNYTNVFGSYIADTTQGPNQATLESMMSATLPLAATGVGQLDIRIITTNAVGADEWIGIDDINVNCNRASAGTSTISGVVSTVKGGGIENATVTAVNTRTQEARVVATNAVGEFLIADLTVGDIYLINIEHNRYRFSNDSQVVQLMEDVTGLRFTGFVNKLNIKESRK